MKLDKNERYFMVKFTLGPQIQTQIQSQAVSPQEAIGLLEMAKDQLMVNLRQGTKNLFNVSKKNNGKDNSP